MQKSFFLLMSTLLLLAWGALAQSVSKGAGKASPVSTTATAPLSKDPIGDADRLFSRGDAPQQDQQALEILESALRADGKNYDLLWRAARAAYYVGDFGPKEDRLKHYEKGIALSQRAVKMKPASVEGHFWLAANYGGKAQSVSDRSQLFGDLKALSIVKKIRNGMQTVVKLNDAYENGNAYLALGEIDRELPGVMGGNKKRAIGLYEQGLKVAPQNLDLKVALSKAYKEAGRKEEARRLLEEVIKATPTTRIQRDAQEEAKQLLNK